MTALSTLAWRDREHRAIAERIRKFGVSITMVGSGPCDCCGAEAGPACGDEYPPFAYTTGLFGIGHPELLVFHDDPAGAGALLNDLSRRVLAGQVLVPGHYVAFTGSHRGYVEDVPNPGEIVYATNEFYQRPPEASVPVLQVTFSDHAGRLPWHDGYAGDPIAQPRPGEFRA